MPLSFWLPVRLLLRAAGVSVDCRLARAQSIEALNRLSSSARYDQVWQSSGTGLVLIVIWSALVPVKKNPTVELYMAVTKDRAGSARLFQLVPFVAVP